MAAVTIIRTYFRVIMNVSVETAQIIINQGLDDFDPLVEFSEADTKTLCMTILCPGGMIINMRANIADQPPTVREPIHLIYMISEKRLLMTAYVKIHQSCTSRPIESQLTTRAFIISLSPLRDQELAYSDPQEIYKPLKDTSMSKRLESLYDYLLKRCGVNKFLLAYVAKAQVVVKPHAADPATDY